MEYDGDPGFSGFDDMGTNMHFNMGNMNGGTTKFFFNGQDMGASGMDPNQIFSMFFNQGGDDDFGGFGGFGSHFAEMRGGNKAGKGSNEKNGKKNTKTGFTGFPGFGNFGGFRGFGGQSANFNN